MPVATKTSDQFLKLIFIQKSRIWSDKLKIILVEPADSDCIYENAKAHILQGDSERAKVRVAKCRS